MILNFILFIVALILLLDIVYLVAKSVTGPDFTYYWCRPLYEMICGQSIGMVKAGVIRIILLVLGVILMCVSAPNVWNYLFK